MDRMLEPPLDPMYPDLKERDRSMLGRSRDRSPLLEKRGEKYRRGKSQAVKAHIKNNLFLSRFILFLHIILHNGSYEIHNLIYFIDCL